MSAKETRAGEENIRVLTHWKSLEAYWVLVRGTLSFLALPYLSVPLLGYIGTIAGTIGTIAGTIGTIDRD